MNAQALTEHQLQRDLTREWVSNGVVIAGERFHLAAWEVMDNYRINSAQHGFGRPAIDFLLLDSHGRLVALELKMTVRAPRECWSVLCQVTHRAQRLAEAYNPVLLDAVYCACHSGAHGRVETNPDVNLAEAHARSFDIKPLPVLPGLPARRVVAATQFGPAWRGIREAFVERPHQASLETVSRYSPRGGAGREFTRWIGLAPEEPSVVAPGVLDFVVEPPQQSDAQ